MLAIHAPILQCVLLDVIKSYTPGEDHLSYIIIISRYIGEGARQRLIRYDRVVVSRSGLSSLKLHDVIKVGITRHGIHDVSTSVFIKCMRGVCMHTSFIIL